MNRCPWCLASENMKNYHDHEWGVVVHDDRLHFEYIILDAFQAGLSWSTILNRREGFRHAFDNFEPAEVARYNEKKIEELMQDTGIIRNRQKILASVKNAKAFLRIQEQHGSFDAYIWQFTNGQTLMNTWEDQSQIPARTTESDAMSKALIKEGFSFVGSTICYAYMQAAGIVHDHITSCFRYGIVSEDD